MVFESGWRWSETLPEYTGTDNCRKKMIMVNSMNSVPEILL